MFLRPYLLKVISKNYFKKITMKSCVEAKEFKIKTPYGFIAAKYWNESSQQTPILAIHGWMDNAGSWDHLLPMLDKDYPVVAIDIPGHGLSSSPPIGMGSYITDNLITIHRVLEHLKWKKVILLGHSMGGGSAMLYCGTMPDVVEKLIIIDILKPLHTNPEDQTYRTAKSLRSLLETEKLLSSSPPKYSYDDIVSKLVKSYGQSLTEKSAQTLLIRGSKKYEDGLYSFAHSPMLKATNTLSMTLEQQEAFASNVACDFLLIKAESSPKYYRKEVFQNFVELYKKSSRNFVLEIVQGTHHVHMNDPEPIAEIINNFLHDLPQKEDRKNAAENYLECKL